MRWKKKRDGKSKKKKKRETRKKNYFNSPVFVSLALSCSLALFLSDLLESGAWNSLKKANAVKKLQ